LAAFADDWGFQRAEHFVALVVSTWKVGPSWKHCLKRVYKEKTTFVVEALFSVPTRRRPIPNATASVFFCVDPGPDGFEKYVPQGPPSPSHYPKTSRFVGGLLMAFDDF
jgi:hypothetical protein